MKNQVLTKIRIVTSMFIILLALSGITAFPLVTEVNWMVAHLHYFPTFFHSWIISVAQSVNATPSIVLYGTDWLAFGHLVIALFFVGVYIDPVKNQFTINVGIIACLGVFPIAFICGSIRAIPFYHQLIDCAFGALGIIPLLYVKHLIVELENKDNVASRVHSINLVTTSVTTSVTRAQ